jgi:hypothetical protein
MNEDLDRIEHELAYLSTFYGWREPELARSGESVTGRIASKFGVVVSVEMSSFCKFSYSVAVDSSAISSFDDWDGIRMNLSQASSFIHKLVVLGIRQDALGKKEK